MNRVKCEGGNGRSRKTADRTDSSKTLRLKNPSMAFSTYVVCIVPVNTHLLIHIGVVLWGLGRVIHQPRTSEKCFEGFTVGGLARGRRAMAGIERR